MSEFSRPVLLDELITKEVPSFASQNDLEQFEQTPYADRIAAQSTYQALQIGAAANPDSPAIQFLPNASPDDNPIIVSHRQLVSRVTQTANLFTELGVGPDDVVSFLLPLLPQSFYVLFGAEAAGIANPINPLLEPHQLIEILNAANTSVLVALGPLPDTDIWAKVEKIRGQLPKLRKVVQIGGKPQPGTVDFDSVLPTYPGDGLTSRRQIKASDVAAYFHTGGTTGTPKLVRHTHGNQVYQAWVMNTMMPSPAGSTILFGLPLFHVGGALTQGLSAFTSGGCAVVLSASGWRNGNGIANVWKLVERYRPATLGGVPTVLTAAVNIPVNGADISSLQNSSGGGAAIPVAVGKKLDALLGKPVIEVYGMTETASVHTLSYPGRPIRLGSVGHAVPYSQVRIVKLDGDGRLVGDCEPNEIGVVAMAGPGVFSGYLNDEHNAGAFVEPGWVNSGDLGRLDEDGYLWITGRAKDLIIRGGHNIDPAAIEETLYQHPDVALAALVGQPDAYAGELPLAYVQLKPGSAAGPEDLLAYVREHTPERAAVPVDIVLIDAMPLTGVGKVFKPQIRWDAAQRVFAQVLAPLAEQGLEISVQVGAHGTHGSMATVSASGVGAGQREETARQVKERLAPFVMAHQLVWGDEASPDY
ncbi:MAG: acyl-CoA synthetase [Burkholderiaceae bacterium]